MKRVDPASLEMSIYIQLRVLGGATKTHLQHIGSDRACRVAARLIIERCCRGSRYSPRTTITGDIDRTSSAVRPWVPNGGRVSSVGPKHGHGRHASRPVRTIVACARSTISTRSAKNSPGAMWHALVPETRFGETGEQRASFLLIAHRAITWLDRADAPEGE
jgi:hypothetical protein